MTPGDFYPTYRKYLKINTDSRVSSPGSVFFALHGDHFNGNLFAREALEKGAAVAVVDDPLVDIDDRFVVVGDTLVFLQELARLHRETMTVPVIGLTGTNGKTTTKELIHAVLRKSFKTVCTQGNLNNHIGVPLTLLSASDDTEILVVEMGANHIGEISHLCTLVQPTHGLITNIGKAHLEGFGSFEGVIQAKSELYGWLRNHGGVIFRNGDDRLLGEITGDYPCITYGTAQDSKIFGTETGSGRRLNMNWHSPRLPGGGLPIHTQLAGSYNLYNILAAIAVADQFNISSSWIKQALESYRPGNMRSEWRETETNIILMDAYNANPSSMKLAIEGFHALQAENKTLVLGDMFELGVSAGEEHQAILLLIKDLGFEKVFVCGDHFYASAVPPIQAFPSTTDLYKHLKTNALHNQTILLKGSRGMKLENLIELF